VFERHQVIEQENTFTGEEFPDCIAPSPLAGGNDVIVTCALADDVSPMSVLRAPNRTYRMNIKYLLFALLIK